MRVQKVCFSAPRRLQEGEEGGAEFRQNLNEHRTLSLDARFDAEYASRNDFVIRRGLFEQPLKGEDLVLIILISLAAIVLLISLIVSFTMMRKQENKELD